MCIRLGKYGQWQEKDLIFLLGGGGGGGGGERGGGWLVGGCSVGYQWSTWAIKYPNFQ